MAQKTAKEYSTKYNTVDSELNYINSKFISLNDEEKKVTTEFFTKFMKEFVNEMKKADKLFDCMFQSILHAGSYYDGLKIGKPDEYDLDLIFNLPISYNELKVQPSSGKPGYVQLRMTDLEYLKLLKNQHWSDRYYVMADWFDKNKFFIPDKFRCWLQSVVQTTFNKKNFSNNGLMATFTTSGPAITLHLRKDNINFSVDLVPVLEMKNRDPPQVVSNFNESEKLNPSGKKSSWYVVPKPIKNTSNNNGNKAEVNINWRLAFHENEKLLISGNERLKPALRLLKKFRDTQNFSKIASYYLKTICLWELKKPENNLLFVSASLSYVFVHLLKAFSEALKTGTIPYYWQKENNLLSVVRKETIENNSNTLKKIIDKIEADPKLIPSYICGRELDCVDCKRMTTRCSSMSLEDYRKSLLDGNTSVKWICDECVVATTTMSTNIEKQCKIEMLEKENEYLKEENRLQKKLIQEMEDKNMLLMMLLKGKNLDKSSEETLSNRDIIPQPSTILVSPLLEHVIYSVLVFMFSFYRK